jgi:hypothetical protein
MHSLKQERGTVPAAEKLCCGSAHMTLPSDSGDPENDPGGGWLLWMEGFWNWCPLPVALKGRERFLKSKPLYINAKGFALYSVGLA